MAINREQILKARELRERAKLFNTTDVEQIAAIFSPDALRRLDIYQQRLFNWAGKPTVGRIVSRPLTATIRQNHSDQTHLLTHNTAMYNDDLEDGIYKDPVVVALTSETRSHPDNEQIRDALRARRVTLATLAHIESTALTGQATTIPLDQPAVPDQSQINQAA